METLQEAKQILTSELLDELCNKEIIADSVRDDKAIQLLHQEVSDAILGYETRIKQQCFKRYFALGYEYACQVHDIK